MAKFDPSGMLNPGLMGTECKRISPKTQLENPGLQRANEILRSCVHCGFCTATCPTYQVLGDELDSPRGRIYLIKDMLENDRPADEKTVKHVDRCLSCLACMTTCPSGVHYMHLVDLAREHIEQTYTRPLGGPAASLDAGAYSALSQAVSGGRAGGLDWRPFKGLLPAEAARTCGICAVYLPPVSRNDDAQVFPLSGRRKSAWP